MSENNGPEQLSEAEERVKARRQAMKRIAVLAAGAPTAALLFSPGTAAAS